MMDKTDNLNHEFIKPIETDDKQDTTMNREVFKTDLGQIMTWTMHLEEGQGMDNIIKVGQGMIQTIEVITEITGMEKQSYERNRSRSCDSQTRGNNRRENRSISNSRSRSGSRASTNTDRIRCFKCQEYDHFARDCPTTQADREVEQIQQMFNMDEDQTILHMPLIDTDQVRQSIKLQKLGKI